MEDNDIKAVIFDVGGVLVSSPVSQIQEYEREMKLPKGALTLAFIHGSPNNAFCRLERGEMPLSQFCTEFEKECKELMKSRIDVDFPTQFSVQELFKRFTRNKINKEMIEMLRQAKKSGLKVGVVTNNWIDDINPVLDHSLWGELSNYIDVMIQSCRVGIRKPDKEIYLLACRELDLKPKQVAFLDDLGANLKSARELGMKTILVKDIPTAVSELRAILQGQISENITKSKL